MSNNARVVDGGEIGTAQYLQAPELATGMAYVGLLPFVDHGLPDEDGAAPPVPRPGAPRVAVVRYPTASNLDELKPLEQVADVVWARGPGELGAADLVIVPCSKHVGKVAEAVPGDHGYVRDTVLGVSAHGVLESPEVVASLVGRAPTRTLDHVFDDLADLVEERLALEGDPA